MKGKAPGVEDPAGLSLLDVVGSNQHTRNFLQFQPPFIRFLNSYSASDQLLNSEVIGLVRLEYNIMLAVL